MSENERLFKICKTYAAASYICVTLGVQEWAKDDPYLAGVYETLGGKFDLERFMKAQMIIKMNEYTKGKAVASAEAKKLEEYESDEQIVAFADKMSSHLCNYNMPLDDFMLLLRAAYCWQAKDGEDDIELACKICGLIADVFEDAELLDGTVTFRAFHFEIEEIIERFGNM